MRQKAEYETEDEVEEGKSSSGASALNGWPHCPVHPHLRFLFYCKGPPVFLVENDT